MFTRTTTTAIVTLAATLIVVARLTPQTRTLVITGIDVVDVVDGRIIANSTVTVTGDTIVGVTPKGAAPRGATVVDGRGAFLVPGLWDMHAHMEMSGASWLALYVANGVTGIRDMGSELDLILKMRDDVAARRVVGPRIFAAGPILDDAPGEWPFRMRVKTADEARAAVQLLKRRGVDRIKVHDHTPRDAFFAIADEARRQNLPLAGHRPMSVTLEEMIDAGQRDLEHLDNEQLWKPCPGQGYQPGMCQELFAMLARRGVWQTPTLVAISELGSIGTAASSVSADHFAYAPKRIREMWAGNQSLFATPDAVRAMKADAIVGAAVTADMAKAGVGILAGCDSMIAGFCVHDELAAMVRGGMTPLAALQTATLNPARYFGIEQTAGTVAPGRRADLVVLDRNPLMDISNVSRIRAVVLAGRLLDRKELDRLLAAAKRAAQSSREE
jgi:imidazolonepropionase-like amidohydrolase